MNNLSAGSLIKQHTDLYNSQTSLSTTMSGQFFSLLLVFAASWVLLSHVHPDCNAVKERAVPFYFSILTNVTKLSLFGCWCSTLHFFLLSKRNTPTPMTCSWGERRSCLELRGSTTLSCWLRGPSITRLVRTVQQWLSERGVERLKCGFCRPLSVFCLNYNSGKTTDLHNWSSVFFWHHRSGEDQGLHWFLPVWSSPTWRRRHWWGISIFWESTGVLILFYLAQLTCLRKQYLNMCESKATGLSSGFLW